MNFSDVTTRPLVSQGSRCRLSNKNRLWGEGANYKPHCQPQCSSNPTPFSMPNSTQLDKIKNLHVEVHYGSAIRHRTTHQPDSYCRR